MRGNSIRLILLILILSAGWSCKKEENPEGFTWSPDPANSGQEVTFSTPYYQVGYTSEWGFGDTYVGTTAYGEIRHTYASPGNYTVSLSIYDQNGVGVWAFSKAVPVH